MKMRRGAPACRGSPGGYGSSAHSPSESYARWAPLRYGVSMRDKATLPRPVAELISRLTRSLLLLPDEEHAEENLASAPTGWSWAAVGRYEVEPGRAGGGALLRLRDAFAPAQPVSSLAFPKRSLSAFKEVADRRANLLVLK